MKRRLRRIGAALLDNLGVILVILALIDYRSGHVARALFLLAALATVALIRIAMDLEMIRRAYTARPRPSALTLPQYTNLMGDPLTGEVEITTRYRTGPGEHFTKEHIRGGTR